MKIAYAFRRCASYPYNGGELPTDATDRRRFLEHSKKIGFDGIELPAMNLPDAEAATFRSELEDAGMPCVAIRGGGGAAHPRVAAANKQSMINAVNFAANIGAGVVNSHGYHATPRPGWQRHVSWRIGIARVKSSCERSGL